MGMKCYEALYGRKSPCGYCIAGEVMETQKPALMRRDDGSGGSEKDSCVYTYPILSGDRTETQIDVAAWTPGIYSFVINLDGQIRTLKFLKQ